MSEYKEHHDSEVLKERRDTGASQEHRRDTDSKRSRSGSRRSEADESEHHDIGGGKHQKHSISSEEPADQTDDLIDSIFMTSSKVVSEERPSKGGGKTMAALRNAKHDQLIDEYKTQFPKVESFSDEASIRGLQQQQQEEGGDEGYVMIGATKVASYGVSQSHYQYERSDAGDENIKKETSKDAADYSAAHRRASPISQQRDARYSEEINEAFQFAKEEPSDYKDHSRRESQSGETEPSATQEHKNRSQQAVMPSHEKIFITEHFPTTKQVNVEQPYQPKMQPVPFEKRYSASSNTNYPPQIDIDFSGRPIEEDELSSASLDEQEDRKHVDKIEEHIIHENLQNVLKFREVEKQAEKKLNIQSDENDEQEEHLKEEEEKHLKEEEEEHLRRPMKFKDAKTQTQILQKITASLDKKEEHRKDEKKEHHKETQEDLHRSVKLRHEREETENPEAISEEGQKPINDLIKVFGGSIEQRRSLGKFGHDIAQEAQHTKSHSTEHGHRQSIEKEYLETVKAISATTHQHPSAHGDTTANQEHHAEKGGKEAHHYEVAKELLRKESEPSSQQETIGVPYNEDERYMSVRVVRNVREYIQKISPRNEQVVGQMLGYERKPRLSTKKEENNAEILLKKDAGVQVKVLPESTNQSNIKGHRNSESSDHHRQTSIPIKTFAKEVAVISNGQNSSDENDTNFTAAEHSANGREHEVSIEIIPVAQRRQIFEKASNRRGSSHH